MAPRLTSVPTVVRRLGWVSFFTDVAAEMIYPLLPGLLRAFGTASIWLGAMEGIAEAASAVVKWRIGPLVDRAPRKKPLIVAGYALATFARPLVAFAFAGWHVMLLRSLDRIGKGVRGVPRDALLASSVPSSSLATAFAFHRMMDNAGSVLGPVVAFALLRLLELPVRTVILAALLPGLVSIAVLVFGVHERGEGAGEPEPPPDREAPSEGGASSAPASQGTSAPPAVLSPEVKRYLGVLALFTLGSSADSFLLLRAVEIGVPEAWAPVMWLSLSLAKTLSNMPGGSLADRVGRRLTLVVAWVLYAAFYAALPHVRSPLAFALVVVAYGTYYGLSEGSERALMASLAPASVRGRAFGAMHAVTGLAVLPANLGFGLLYAVRPAYAFGLGAACAGSAAVLLALFVKAPRPPEQSATLSP